MESTYTLNGGVIIDLHYLVAVVPVAKTCFVDLHYQLLPKPARLELGNRSGVLDKEEYKQELAGIVGAWKIYKRNINR